VLSATYLSGLYAKLFAPGLDAPLVVIVIALPDRRCGTGACFHYPAGKLTPPEDAGDKQLIRTSAPQGVSLGNSHGPRMTEIDVWSRRFREKRRGADISFAIAGNRWLLQPWFSGADACAWGETGGARRPR